VRPLDPTEGELKRPEPRVKSASQESVPSKTRRKFTASEKLRLVKAAEAALASGERGALEAMLREEGIYSSQLSAWRTQLGARGEAGLASRTPGRRPKLSAKDRELLAVIKQNEVLQRKLRIANALISLQKNHRERGRISPDGSACRPETPCGVVA
jgi:transposase-like protein